MTTVISIGRNTNESLTGLQLDKETWAEFRREVRNVVGMSGIVFDGVGVGIYDGDVEDSFTLITTTTLTRSQRSKLGWLAFKYGQDCIAVTQGETEFVEASSVVLRP